MIKFSPEMLNTPLLRQNRYHWANGRNQRGDVRGIEPGAEPPC